MSHILNLWSNEKNFKLKTHLKDLTKGLAESNFHPFSVYRIAWRKDRNIALWELQVQAHLFGLQRRRKLLQFCWYRKRKSTRLYNPTKRLTLDNKSVLIYRRLHCASHFGSFKRWTTLLALGCFLKYFSSIWLEKVRSEASQAYTYIMVCSTLNLWRKILSSELCQINKRISLQFR